MHPTGRAYGATLGTNKGSGWTGLLLDGSLGPEQNLI